MDLNQLPEVESDRLIKEYGDLAEAGRALEKARDLGGDCSISQRMVEILITRSAVGESLYNVLSVLDESVKYDKIDVAVVGGRILQFDPTELRIHTQHWDMIHQRLVRIRASGMFKERPLDQEQG